ncbi:toll-like receptor Tollo [Dermacentor andersoni]|uniref:toll-like receptor Tollo n=1 Tax=Dermacentor andersoni TaxID=34620 RepID=UPI0021551577|nr:toll-like receptor Tollo [Dermacentor andersoni]
MRRSAALLLALLWWLRAAAQPGVVAARYVAPEDCRWEPLDATGVALTCAVRTLSGGPEPSNFSLIQPGHTARLTVRCDDLLFQSDLTNGSFAHLSGLRSLSIERCKLEDVPALAFAGLAELQNLSLRTYNTEWGKLSLRLAPDSLAPLRQLVALDLSRNNMDYLPPSILCPLVQLAQLNLTRNRFADATRMGFAETRCSPLVQKLDAAYNRLRLLPEKAFASLRQLRELKLDHNQIARAEQGALFGLSRLHNLDLAHNALVALPPRFLQPAEMLSELYLRNNSLSALPPALFAGLHQLTMLDLAHNQLSSGWLGAPDTLADLTRLAVLDLSHNRLTRLDDAAFRSLHNLQTLQLQHNLIESIADLAFASLYNLHTLVLSHNRLKFVGTHMFTGLSSLGGLYVDHNRLESLAPDAFHNVTNLQEIILAGNRLSSVPRVVQTLQLLRSLDVADNMVADIQNASYQGLRQLYGLNLMGNHIGNLSQGAFHELPSLRILNLARNGIQSIEQGTFDDVPDLHALRLDSNFLDDVNGLFSNLHDLIMLNISANRVRWFDYALIPIGLQWLDIHDNQIEALGNYFELESILKLRTLDVSHNRLTDLDSSSLPNGIEIVFLKGNQLRRIQPFTFLGKQNLTRVDLTDNKLETLDMTMFRLSEVPSGRPLPQFMVAGNPYLCDCHMEWLQRLGHLDDSRQYPRVIDLADVACHLSFSRRKATLALVTAQSSEFLCRYRNHCFALCHCCDFDACDCEMVCPDNCTCYYDQSWNTNIVDCSARAHGAVPKQLPMDVTELYLDGNDIPTLSSHTYIGRKNMKVLYLNSSNVQTINNRTFSGLRTLRVLRLDHNRLATLHGYEFDGLGELRELYLSYNHLTSINNATFLPLKSLEVLHLDHNYILAMAVGNLQPRLNDVRLSDNPWSCDCRFVQELADFLQNRGADLVVRDLLSVHCVHNETAVLPLWELNATSCTNASAASTHARHVQDLLPLLVVVGVVFLLLVCVVAVALVYRRQMSVWFYTKYGVRVFQRAPAEEEKLFDAFVSYSKKDEAFVAQILAPELECGSPPYRLCLHYRDLPMAGGYLTDAISEAVESSRRTIVILSEHFLKSEWCRYEFKSAHHEVLHGCSHRLVVVFLGRVSFRELDPDIRLWLKSSTFLRWGEKRFWDKLRYAMPDTRHRKVAAASGSRSDVASVHI